VSATNDEGLIYLSPDQININRGDRVRIIGGMFSGCEGTLMRIRGDRRFVVSIPGVMAVATAFIHPSLIMKIDEK
ncbi:MAG: transcriptional regulator, partial [Bacteroidales bacterium]|nr:transcriptional regulator [Bacteroidales bacterium]